MELADLIFKIIMGMDEKYKNALLLCEVEGLSHKEVSKILRCNMITVGTWVRRARMILFKLLREYVYKF